MHVHCKVTENRNDGGNNRTLFLDRAFDVRPGQFVMAWVPGESEKPFSLSYENAFTIKNLGWYSEGLIGLKAGDSVWLRGPYGTSFPLGEGAVLLGGGVGIAALLILANGPTARPSSSVDARPMTSSFWTSSSGRERSTWRRRTARWGRGVSSRTCCRGRGATTASADPTR